VHYEKCQKGTAYGYGILKIGADSIQWYELFSFAYECVVFKVQRHRMCSKYDAHAVLIVALAASVEIRQHLNN